MIFYIMFVPFFSFLFVITGSRLIGIKGSCYLSSFCILISTLLSFFKFYDILSGGPIEYMDMFEWISVGSLKVSWGFLIDPVSSVMLVVITFISFLVHIYSIEYMSSDPHLPRFMAYLSLFTFFMIMLVTANNFLQMFFGWEGVGLASYLLINFWNTRIQANKSAIKAILVNRVGDLGLIISMASIYDLFKSLDYAVVFSTVESLSFSKIVFLSFEVNYVSFIVLFMFIGCIGKSAQLGLHTWLPDAMEGPTPVSALIHAATMVTAGVFLLVRCSPLVEFSGEILSVISIFGGVTAFFAATVATSQNDIKRVIAYSTCSQLGYMIFCCGISSYNVAMFHLSNHAFFKALLFLSAGSVIHALSNEQDMRKMGGMIKLLPLTYSVMLIGTMALIGFPFLTGFYSKDLILEVSFYNYTFYGRFVYFLGLSSAFMTAFYSFRLLYMIFISNSNSFISYIKNIHEPKYMMSIPLIILSIPSILVGYLSKDLFVGMGTDFWGSSITVKDINTYPCIESEFLPYYIKIIPVVFSLSSMFLSLFLYTYYPSFLIYIKVNNYLYLYFNKRWFFDIIYNGIISKNIMKFGYNVGFKVLDRGFVNIIGPLGLENSIRNFSELISKSQTGLLYHYMFLILTSLSIMIYVIFFSIYDILFYKIMIIYVFMYIFYNKN